VREPTYLLRAISAKVTEVL